MSGDLRREMESLRQISFGSRYGKIRQVLEREGNEKRKKEFRELEDYFFHMVTFILANQDQQGWWTPGHELQNIITAHAVRHFHKIGISLKARWNLQGATSKEGNLYRATRLLIEAFDDSRQNPFAYWGTDVWDDCYILLALLEVQPELQDEEVKSWGPGLRNQFQKNLRKSLNWLKGLFDEKGFNNKKVTSEAWYGPGFYAGAIELFAHPSVKTLLPEEADELVAKLAAAVKLGFEEGFNGKKWHNRFAWHVGQILVTWREKRESYTALAELDPLMMKLFEELKERQSDNGAWDNDGDITDKEYQVYYTVRALAACYVNTKDKDFPKSKSIERAHKFILDKFKENSDGLLVNPKASINALAAFQRLFEFRIHNIFPNLLISLTARINRLGLLDNILNPHANESDTLEEIRASARWRLEEQGKSGLELLGVNDQLYRALKDKDEFLNEFTGDRSSDVSNKESEEILSDLRRCLSATLTETRSKLSHRLIRKLWDTDGFLNFIPLIEHLSDLEQDRAFYKYYRDHLNHELLLFLFGSYIYYNCKTFREKINDEILRIYEDKEINFGRGGLTGEFLFRWKLISTFHDIGYLFEVDPFKDKSIKRIRTKEELLKKSFRVVDEFRENFLFDYFMQNIEAPRIKGKDKKAVESAHETEVKALAADVAKKLTPYRGRIKEAKNLFKLTTGGDYGDAFKLISQYVGPTHIGPDFIENYFHLCNSTTVFEEEDGKIKKVRDPFYDHGIMSALILLKAADIQRHYLKGLTDKDFSGTLLNRYPKLREILRQKKTKDHLDVEQFFVRFSHVAGAIALHNIIPRLYTKEQCEEFDKNSPKPGQSITEAFYKEPSDAAGRYMISLDENPLSYLTALADTLQDWDRHSFRRLSFGEDSKDPLSSSEVVIGFSEEDKLNVSPLTDEAKKKYALLTGPKAMDQYLLNWKRYVKIGDD